MSPSPSLAETVPAAPFARRPWVQVPRGLQGLPASGIECLYVFSDGLNAPSRTQAPVAALARPRPRFARG